MPRVDAATTAAPWAAPLDRPVSAHANVIALREALERVASLAKIRLSYSRELLPLDSAVCLSADATAVGRVLSDLLIGTNLAALAVGDDQVVLAPRPALEPRASSSNDMASSMGVLDRVVVTGSAMGASERQITIGLDVLSGQQLARENVTTLSSALDGFVPGMWSWTQSPSTLLSS